MLLQLHTQKKALYTSLLLMNNPFSLRRRLGDTGVTLQTGAGKYGDYQRKGKYGSVALRFNILAHMMIDGTKG